MTVLDDILAAQNNVSGRLGAAEQTTKTNDALGMVNVDDDRRRMQLLESLKAILADPSRQASITQAADSQFAEAGSGIDRNVRIADSNLVANAAGNGTLGGSRQLAGKGNIAAAGNQQKRTAAAGVEDLKTTAQNGHDDTVRTYLDQILTPTTGAQGANTDAMNAQRLDLDLENEGIKNQQDFRGSLASMLAGIVQNGVTPGITAGFDRAERQNRKSMTDWDLGGRTGATPNVSRTWNLWGGA
jgi:hypothetical protein